MLVIDTLIKSQGGLAYVVARDYENQMMLESVCQMEASVEKYKRRLEDMAELRQQVKELDDLNSKYLDQVWDVTFLVWCISSNRGLRCELAVVLGCRWFADRDPQ